jgi:hypothetical protein
MTGAYMRRVNICIPFFISHFQAFFVTQRLWLGDCFSGIS